MAERFIFDVGQENDSQPRLRGLLDDVKKEIIIFNDLIGKEEFRIGATGIEDATETYKELVYTVGNLTQINIWQDDSMTLKLYQTDFTYDINGTLTGKQVTRIIDNFSYTVLFTYDINGTLINTKTIIN